MHNDDTPADFKWIVLKNDELGARLASLSPAEMLLLRSDFERAYGIAISIEEFDDELDERDGA